MKKIILFICIISIITPSTLVYSAGIDFKINREILPTGSEYIFKNFPDEDLMTVQILGAVNKPGIYHVPQSTDVVTMLSLTGGVFENANLEKVVLRKNSKKTINFLSLNDMISDIDVMPSKLDNGDVLFVNVKEPWLDNNTLTLITVGSLLLSSVLTVIAIRDTK